MGPGPEDRGAGVNVHYPKMRAQLAEELAHLSDADYQQKIWIDCDFEADQYFDSFEDVVRFFFQFTPLFEDPRSTIGYILACEAEADVVAELTQILDTLVQRLGSVPEAQYMKSAEWPQVMALAAQARAQVLENGGI